MIRNLLFSVFLFCFISGFSQEYFQQKADFRIHVSLDDINHRLSAAETVLYTNNSPDNLEIIYFHLWPNAYQYRNTALGNQLRENGELQLHFGDIEETGKIDSLDFKINGEKIKWDLTDENSDIALLQLPKPLLPGESITITTPFNVKIPAGHISRLGHIGQQYQITQWFPKPAVYDRDGWHPMPYLDQGEFYSEFGTFDVFINLPENYVVASTGDLQNKDELLFMETKAWETEAWIRDLEEKDGLKNLKDPAFPASSDKRKTLHYHQENIHDFAWFCDKRYKVLKGGIKLPHSGREVTTWTMFTDGQTPLWGNSIGYMNDAIFYYSLWNGDYPYNQATAVDGALSAGGGMEYPNVTVIGKMSDPFSLEMVIMHEVGHNWFYGILGSNERLHPWLDEGLNSFNESRYIREKYPNALIGGLDGSSGIAKRFDLTHFKYKSQYDILYLMSARKAEDQPIELHAAKYIPLNYGGIVYSKTAIVFEYLMAYLGRETMDRSMQRYFEEWKFKHPAPADLRKIFEEESGKNLSWFFEDIINTTNILDFKITSVKKSPSGFDVTVKNRGVKAPVCLYGLKDGKIKGVIWYEGFEDKAVLTFPADEVDEFRIDFEEKIPEINRNNNSMRTQGLFKKTEPLKFQLIGSLDHPHKSQIFYMPVVGYNLYNSVMPGIALYNNLIPQKNLEYIFLPMFGVKNKDLAGYGQIRINKPVRNGFIKQISLITGASRFAFENEPLDLNFNKLSSEILFSFRNKIARNPWEKIFSYRYVSTATDYAFFQSSEDKFKKNYNQNNYHNLRFQINRNTAIWPVKIDLNYQDHKSFGKIFASLKGSYFMTSKKSMDIRLFGGTMTREGTNPVYQFSLSGRSGYEDYLYDQVFTGRSEFSSPFTDNYSFWGQQFMESDGNFKLNTFFPGFKSLFTANITTHLPYIPQFFRVYGDFLLSGKHEFGSVDEFTYNAGINLSLRKDILEIYIPLVSSENLISPYDAYNGKIWKSIRFVLNINRLNPFEMIRNLKI